MLFRRIMRDIHAYPSSCKRNTRGLGFPSWGTGVTDPTSTKPKPNPNNPSTASAFLSKPAASPTGFANERPQTSSSRTSGSGRVSRGTSPCAAAQIASLWASSGSNSLNTGFTRFAAWNAHLLHSQESKDEEIKEKIYKNCNAILFYWGNLQWHWNCDPNLIVASSDVPT